MATLTSTLAAPIRRHDGLASESVAFSMARTHIGGVTLVAAVHGRVAPQRVAALKAAVSATLDALPEGADRIDATARGRDADGVVLVLDADGGDDGHAVRLDELGPLSSLDGRPVALVAFGDDETIATRRLETYRAAVTDAGGFAVGAGIAVPYIDAGVGGPVGRPRLEDVDLACALALLGRRVRVLAGSRRRLRS